MNEDPEVLAGRIAQLEATIKLAERVAQLEARLKGKSGHGSPQAIPKREERYLIAPRPADALSALDRLRVDFARTGDYTPM